MHDYEETVDGRNLRDLSRALREIAHQVWLREARALVQTHSAYVALLELGADSDSAYEQSGHREQAHIEILAFGRWTAGMIQLDVFAARRERVTELGRSPKLMLEP